MDDSKMLEYIKRGGIAENTAPFGYRAITEYQRNEMIRERKKQLAAMVEANKGSGLILPAFMLDVDYEKEYPRLIVVEEELEIVEHVLFCKFYPRLPVVKATGKVIYPPTYSLQEMAEEINKKNYLDSMGRPIVVAKHTIARIYKRVDFYRGMYKWKCINGNEKERKSPVPGGVPRTV